MLIGSHLTPTPGINRGKVPVPQRLRSLAKSRGDARTIARRVLQFEQVKILHWTCIRARPVVTLEGLECRSLPSRYQAPGDRCEQSERDGECDARSRSPGSPSAHKQGSSRRVRSGWPRRTNLDAKAEEFRYKLQERYVCFMLFLI